MRTSENVEKITAALLAFQKEVTPPPKEQTNPFFKSKYCDLPTLLAHCKDLLTKNGLVFVSAGLTSRIMHTSGQWIEGDFACKTDQMSAQQVGAAESYGRRYGFQGLLGICAEDDDDGNAASAPSSPRKEVLKNIPTPPPKAPAPIPGAGPYKPPPDGAVPDGGDMIEATVLATSKTRNDGGSYGILVKVSDHGGNCPKITDNRAKCDCGAEKWLNTFHDTPWNTAKTLKGSLGIFTMSAPNEKGYSNVEHLVGVQG